jgi:adenylate kinase
MNLIIFGPQGSGKGTQAKLLVRKLNCEYFEAGSILRERAKENSLLGKKISLIINRKGALVPNILMKKILSQWLEEIDLKKGIIFDGFPRTLRQYKILKDLLNLKNLKIDKAIYLKLKPEVSLKRLLSRRICPNCKSEFNLLTKPPKKDELCDFCHIKLIRRQDDTPVLIKKRLENYYKEEKPLIEEFKKEKILEEIDGDRPIEEIFQDILRRLSK